MDEFGSDGCGVLEAWGSVDFNEPRMHRIVNHEVIPIDLKCIVPIDHVLAPALERGNDDLLNLRDGGIEQLLSEVQLSRGFVSIIIIISNTISACLVILFHQRFLLVLVPAH